MATYHRSTTERWLLAAHMQSRSFPPPPHMSTTRKSQESTDTAEQGLCLCCTSQPQINTTVLCFLPFDHFSGKQIHARNHLNHQPFSTYTPDIEKCLWSLGECYQQCVLSAVSWLQNDFRNLFISPSTVMFLFFLLLWCISLSFI